MWPASHSSRSRTSRICSSSRALVQLGHGEPLDRRGRQPLLAPARHPAREVARDPPDADRRGQLGGAQRVGVVAADQHDRLVGPGDPRQPRAEARPAGSCCRSRPGCAPRRTAARCGCRSPARRAAATWRGVSGCGVDRRGARSGPRLIATIALKFGGCGRRSAVARATNSSSSATPQQLVVAALVADRRADTFRSIAGPPHSEPPRWPGPDLDVVAELQQRRAASGRSRARPPPSRPPGPGRAMSPTNSESPVSTAHGSSPRAVSISANAVCSGRCPGVCSARTTTLPERRAPSRPRTARARTRPRPARGRGSARPSPPPAGRGRTRGRRGCGSRGCARSRRRGSARAAGTRRCPAAGRRPPRRPRPRRRPGSDAQPRSSCAICRKITRANSTVRALITLHVQPLANLSDRD